jgi:antitoxin component YwqK of YwqJK toxin-antitoxin module
MRSFGKNRKDRSGRKQGYWEHYYDDNSYLHSKGSYKNDKKEGIWEYYHDNGNLWRKGLYLKGELHGYWDHYRIDGKLVLKKLFENGDLII